MSLLVAFLLLIVGFLLLIKGADSLVEGASSLALRFHIKPIVIGLTVVAFGTSTPELIVNILSALKGNTDIAFGNILGSNIANILLILGVSAVIHPLETKHNTIWREIPFSLLAVFVLFVMTNDGFFAQEKDQLALNDGLVLLMFFLVFLGYNFSVSKVQVDDVREVKEMALFKIILLIVFGLIGLFVGGKLVVESAIVMAKFFNLSDKVIGLTVVALGTSLPELFTSAVAASKGKMDIAVGNVVGSNIFNIFLILGITACIRPLPYNTAMNLDFMVLTVVSLMFFFTTFIGQKGFISRWDGWRFIICYVGYTAYLLFKG